MRVLITSLALFALACNSETADPKASGAPASAAASKAPASAAASKAPASAAPASAAARKAPARAAASTAPATGPTGVAKLTVDDVKAVAQANGFKVEKVRELPEQMGIKTTAINLSKGTAIVLSALPKDSPFGERLAKDTPIASSLRAGDFVLTVRSSNAAARKKLLAALDVAAKAK